MPNVTSWMLDYVRSRYGSDDANVQAAWKILLENPYSTNKYNGNMMMSSFPDLPDQLPDYSFCKTYPALNLLFQAADKFGDVDSYKNDLVDLARELLSDLFMYVHNDLVVQFNDKNTTSVK